MLIQKQTERYRKTHCRYCNSPLESPFLDLGATPLANSFLTLEESRKKEFTCPLALSRCAPCGLVQLTHVVPPDLMFSNYLYVSSTTATFRQHFATYAQRARQCVQKERSSILAVDIGSNDGLLLSCYQNEGMTAVGVEPARNLAKEANAKGWTTLNDYFGEQAVNQLLKTRGPADIISANNVFAHIDNIHDVCRNVSRLLHPEGVLIIEFPYLVTMCEEMLFDMIYHEHLSYVAVAPLTSLFRQFDLEIFAIEEVPTHGGSLRVFVQKKGARRPIGREVDWFLESERCKGYGTTKVYQEFAKRVYQVKEELVGFVDQIKGEGKSIAGYGAPAKGNTLINFCRFKPSQIDFIVDDNPLKQDLLTPGAHIPVVSSALLFHNPTDYVLILAWNFADEIVKKLDPLRQSGVRFLIPLPQPRLL
jgi:SAM-dependent methyltransferase